MSGTTLGILLTTGFESENTRTVRKIAEAALGLGHEVHIFLMADGVLTLPALRYLADKGAQITLCAHNALERGIARQEGPVLFGSQYDWAQIVARAERVISFG